MSEIPGGQPPVNPKAAAKAAKAYAKAERPWFKKKRFIALIAIAVIAVIAMASSGGGGGGGGGKDDNDSDGGSANKQLPVVKAGASKLLKEFETNELSADEKYKGKSLLVTGVVDKVDTEVFDDGDYVLKVNGGSDMEFLTVDCYDIPNKKLSALKPGDRVSMQGDFKDGGDLGVELNHCILK